MMVGVQTPFLPIMTDHMIQQPISWFLLRWNSTLLPADLNCPPLPHPRCPPSTKSSTLRTPTVPKLSESPGASALTHASSVTLGRMPAMAKAASILAGPSLHHRYNTRLDSTGPEQLPDSVLVSRPGCFRQRLSQVPKRYSTSIDSARFGRINGVKPLPPLSLRVFLGNRLFSCETC
jgi:hypothetical protein